MQYLHSAWSLDGKTSMLVILEIIKHYQTTYVGFNHKIYLFIYLSHFNSSDNGNLICINIDTRYVRT